MKRALSIFMLSTVLVFASRADAQAPARDPVAATELFKQGREAMNANDWSTARARFTESLRLDEKVGTLMNLAACEDNLGDIALARQHIQRAIDLASAAGDDRVALAREKFAVIDARVPRLTIRLAAGSPAGTIVKRDDAALGEGSLGAALPVQPGAHVVVVEAPGRQRAKIEVTLAERERKEIEVAPGTEVVGAPAPPAGSDAIAAPPSSSSSPLRTIGIVLAGTGVVAAGIGTVFGVVALGKNSDSEAEGRCVDNACNSEGLALREDARSAGNVSTAFVVGGLVCLAAGAVLYFTAPKSTSSAKVDARRGGFVLGGTF
jgi:hypothetical protein